MIPIEAIKLNRDSYFLKNEILTNNDIRILSASLSDSATMLLRTLYKNPNMQHKVLAINTHMSITNLSNCIAKIEAIYPPLIKSEKIGRSKFYSLTNIAEQYVEQVILSPQNVKILPITPISADTAKKTEAIQKFQTFCQKAGPDWDVALSDLLSDIKFKNTEDNELDALFSDFINHVVRLKMHKKNDALQKIYTLLEQNILIKKLNRYLNNLLNRYDILEPLFQLEKTNIAAAYYMIDHMFAELNISENETDSADIQLITESQYNNIFHHLTVMLKEFRQHNCDKKTVLEYWETVYHTMNPILFYIAEKCLCFLKLQTPSASSKSP